MLFMHNFAGNNNQVLNRIRAIVSETTELLATVLGYDFDVESATRWLEAALNDLDASKNPSDEQIEEVFTALANLQGRLTACMVRTPRQHHPLLENLTDRIDIFLFHHRL